MLFQKDMELVVFRVSILVTDSEEVFRFGDGSNSLKKRASMKQVCVFK